jgi:hypothetical protein
MCECKDCNNDDFTFICENKGCTNFICNYHSYEQNDGELWCSDCAKKVKL